MHLLSLLAHEFVSARLHPRQRPLLEGRVAEIAARALRNEGLSRFRVTLLNLLELGLRETYQLLCILLKSQLTNHLEQVALILALVHFPCLVEVLQDPDHVLQVWHLLIQVVLALFSQLVRRDFELWNKNCGVNPK